MAQISDLFVNPEELPNNFGGFVQLLFLMLCYGYFLRFGSHYISDGSELLLLVPSVAGLVGSVVLPVLGAVPDGAIVLFSGLGENAQEQLTIGVGALAGSTIMLITLPWALCILAGRVDLDKKGQPVYKRPAGAGKEWTKLSKDKGLYHTLFHTGIGLNRPIRINALIMIASAASFLLIQIPSFALGCGTGKDCSEGHRQKWWALAGFLLSLVSFLAYLVYQVRVGGSEEHHEQKMTGKVAHLVSEGHASVAAAFWTFMHEQGEHEHDDRDTAALLESGVSPATALLGAEAVSAAAANVAPSATAAANGHVSAESVGLTLRQNSQLALIRQASQQALNSNAVAPASKAERRLHSMLRRFFKRYDRDNNGVLDLGELQMLLKELGSPRLSPAGVASLFQSMDVNADAGVDFPEFCAALTVIMQHPETVREIEKQAREQMIERKKAKMGGAGDLRSPSMSAPATLSGSASSVDSSPMQRPQFAGSSVNLRPLVAAEMDLEAAQHEAEPDDEEEEEEEEAEEMPDDLKDLTPAAQQRAILRRSAWMMTIGTLLILLFSDPMVECLSELGRRTHIPGFYVAFALAPLAANMSEVMASIQYATKKTPATITISITSLEGSGTMMNTFSLAIFLIIIFAKDLIWVFSAETIAILVVEVIVTLLTLKRVQRTVDAILIFALYPLSMALVAILENVAGLN